MNDQIYLNQKEVTVLMGVFLALLGLVFVAGWLTGVLVGLPGTETPPVAVTQPQPVAPAPVPSKPEPEQEAETPPPRPAYSVQVGSFATQAGAQRHVAELKSRGYTAYIFQTTGAGGKTWFTTRLGNYEDLETARQAAASFTRDNGTVALVTEAGTDVSKPFPEKVEGVSEGSDTAAESEVESEKASKEEATSETPPESEDTPDAVSEGEKEIDAAIETEAAKEIAHENETAPDSEAAPDASSDDTGVEADASDGGDTAEPAHYAVQVGSFRGVRDASALAASLHRKGYDARVWKGDDGQGSAWYAVRIGFCENLAAARQAAENYRQREGGTPLVIRSHPPGSGETAAQAWGASVIKGVLIISPAAAEHYPYTIRLASFPSLGPALDATRQFRRRGLGAYFVNTDPVNPDESFWLVNAGAYIDYATAEAAQAAMKVAGSIIKRNLWASQIGPPMTLDDMAPVFLRLEAADYSPYAVSASDDHFRLLVGSFSTAEGAAAQKQRLVADGFNAEVVSR